MTLLQVLARVVGSFAVMLLMARILGKKQMSQLTFFNYITGITIGSVAASISIDPHIRFRDGLVSLLAWSLLTILVGYIALKFAKARVLLDGEPTIVIKNGKVLEQALGHQRLNMDDLSMLLREKNIFSVQDVDYAILEPNGKISVLQKVEKQSVTKSDLKRKIVKPKYVPSEIIVDSKIITNNMKELGISPTWLQQQIEHSGDNLEDIFYAEIQADGSLFIDKRIDNEIKN